jgi:phosphatidylserine/phosphatidylglycerophosphate/cardiolipin synthase-like enzyme
MATPFLPADPAVRLEPPTSGTAIEHLLGGAVALPRMLADIRSAVGPAAFVYLAGWQCESDLVVPVPSGADTLGDALRAVTQAGGQVRLLLWAGTLDTQSGGRVGRIEQRILQELAVRFSPLAAHNAATAKLVTELAASGGDAYCHLDSRHLFAGSHHQKLLIVATDRTLTAYIGGIEFSTNRLYATEPSGKVIKGAPLFDLALRVIGTAADGLLQTFMDRWAATATGPMGRLPPLRGATRLPVPRAAPELHGDPRGSEGMRPPATADLDAQVSHTYGLHCPFPVAIQTAGRAVASVIRTTEQFFYMEDQYYVGPAELAAAIRAALQGDAGRWGVVVLAAEDSMIEPPDLGFRRRALLAPLVEAFPGRFLVFERLGDDGTTTGPTAYVHSKLTIVDDVVAVVGSANSNYRSWTHDSEVLLTLAECAGPGGVTANEWHAIRALRVAHWQRHLVSGSGPPPAVGDPAAARALWSAVWAGRRSAHVRRYETQARLPRPRWARRPTLGEAIWTDLLDPRA